MTWRSLGILLLLPTLAWGQRGMPRPRNDESHIAIPTSAPGVEATELLARKLGEAELPNYLKQLLKDSGAMNEESAQKLLQSPFAADILKRMAEGDPAIMKLVEQYAAGRPELKGLSSDKLRQLLAERANEFLNPGADPEARKAWLKSNLMAEPTAAQREQMARLAYTERITDTLRDMKLDGMLDQLRESPAFQNWMQALGKSGIADNPGPLTLGDTMQVFGGFDQWMQRLRPYLPKNLPSLQNLHISPPSSTTFNLPSFGVSKFNLPWFEALGANWPTVVVLFAVAVIVVIALFRVRFAKTQPLAVRAQLGPWPVDPRQVSTREEVIAAFEYLALLKCGTEAAHWHHHAVARDWSRNPTVRADAESLAALYEQARYAPPDRPGFWESARVALSRLAGGAA
jgi:hypothetical protein